MNSGFERLRRANVIAIAAHVLTLLGSSTAALASAGGGAEPDAPVAGAVPTASFAADCTHLSCTFMDTSGGGDGQLVTWAWLFGDGHASAAQHPSHVYDQGGTYTVSLTVTDEGGASDVFSRTVTVTEPPLQTPSQTADAVASTRRFVPSGSLD